MIALLGLVLLILGLLGLLHVLGLGVAASVVLLVIGVVLLAFDPRVRSRF